VRWINLSTMALALLLCAGTASAQPGPVFGPQTLERTTGETDVYSETFESPSAGEFLLFLRNGDEEGSRVTSATVEINGDAVVQPSDLNDNLPGLRRRVRLEAGANEIAVELAGAPGSFVTVAILPPGVPPLFVHGRLLLPWGRNDAERGLALALKNGSLRAPRALRVVFFRPNGEVAAASERIVLPPRASLAAAVDDLIAAGSWEIGSVEIYYAGPGTARLFGTARHWSVPTFDTEVQTLINAGAKVFRPRPERSDALSGRAPRP
jgi:hypothetical protein